MPTNLAIDDKLIKEAQRIGGFKTKKETVTIALDEFIRKRRQLEIIKSFGQIDFDSKYDYKRSRRRK